MSSSSQFINRLPRRDQAWPVFLICLFPVQAWSWFAFIYKLPSYLLSLSIGQTLSVFAYLQVYALVEAALLWLAMLLVALLLPRRLFLDHLTPQALVLVLALTGLALTLHWLLLANDGAIGAILTTAAVWAAIWLTILIASSWLIRRWKRLYELLAAIPERLSILVGLYLLIDLASLAAIGLRNLIGGLG